MVRDLKSLGPNLQKIVKRLMDNQNLLKLLYYTDKDPLSHEDLTDKQKKKEVYEKLIKVVPRVGPKETAQSLISLRVVIDPEEEIHSITEFIPAAIFYENEMKEIFGVKIKLITNDLNNKLYRINVEAPLGVAPQEGGKE